MSKVIVIDEDEGTRFPFLRGILTHSLQNAGLGIDDSYSLASAIRGELADRVEITTSDLRKLVMARLRPFDRATIKRYQQLPVPASIEVEYEDGQHLPFSRGRQRMDLEASGFTSDDSASVAAGVFDELTRTGQRSIRYAALLHLIHAHVEATLGAAAARQFVVRQEFQQSARPLILLLGGAVGTGKSTIAARVAQRLDIVRTQSTDMLREVMRMMIPKRLLPVLHTSSFLAAGQLPEWDPDGETTGAKDETRLVAGYLAQAELTQVACEAVIQRALRERVSMILEGVNLHPTMLREIQANTDAIVVPVLLAVLKPERLRRRIRGRGRHAPGRRAKRYLEAFDQIWGLQSYFLSEAARVDIPLVPNADRDETVHLVMNLVMDTLSQTFSGTAEEVFG